MGLKDELKRAEEADAAGDSGPQKAPKLSARRAAVSIGADGERVYKHEHYRDQAGVMPDYYIGCKACIADDIKRRGVSIPEEQLDSTVFMIPENSVDAKIVRAYLQGKYGDEIYMNCNIVPTRLAAHHDAQVVVVTRRGSNGGGNVRSTTEVLEDKKGNPVFLDKPLDSFFDEVFESAPIRVSESVTQRSASMFEEASVSLGPLLSKLAAVAGPRYSVASYLYKAGSDEVQFTQRLV